VDPQGQTSSPLTAQCQLHVGQPFTAVCQRCGTYMCAVCSEGGRYTLCAACRERGGVGAFPFRRDAYTLGGLFDFGWKAYKQNWGVLTGGVAIFFVVVMGVSIPFAILQTLLGGDNMATGIAVQAVSFIVQTLIQGVLSLGLFLMGLKAARGEKPQLADLFGGLPRLGTWIAQVLLIGAAITPVAALVGGGFALLMPGLSGTTAFIAAAVVGVLLLPVVLYFSLGVSFAAIEVVAQPSVGAVTSLRNSWAIVSGKRLEIFLFGMAAFVLYMAGFLACLIGVLFTMSYASVVYAAYYLALRNGAPDLRE
jgi:hypothetical protein